jgi:hypothetical protein
MDSCSWIRNIRIELKIRVVVSREISLDVKNMKSTVFTMWKWDYIE